jgi:fructoselysine 3-epimerase
VKISYNNWAYTSFFVWAPAYTLDETIKRLAKIGYDGIEIGAGAPHAYPGQLTPSRRSEVRDLFEEHGIACSSMLPAPSGGTGNNPCSPLAEERAWAINHYKELIDLCETWKAGKLIFLPGWRVFGTTRREAWKWSRAALTEVAEYAGEHNVQLVIEPTSHDTNMCESSYDAIELMEDVGSPNVKLMFDTFHVLYRREVISDYVYEMGADLTHVHIADSDRLPPGKGRGDFPAMMDALIDVGFDGYLTMETGFHERGIEPDLDARECLEYLRPLVDSKLAERKGA